MSFCKQLLGVQKQTTNIGVLLELGQIPLSIYAKKMAIKNWVRISNRSYCNDLTVMSYENSLSLNLTWPTRIKNISEIGMLQDFISVNTNAHCLAFQRMSDIFHQNSFSEIRKESGKLRTYSLLKNEIGYEEYLNDIRNSSARVALTKLRLSNHRLNIEVGRHKKIAKHLRFCPFCPIHLEDEIHFLLECKTFQNHRSKFINTILDITGDFPSLSIIDKFRVIMTKKEITPHSAIYVTRLFAIREYLLNHHKNNSIPKCSSCDEQLYSA